MRVISRDPFARTTLIRVQFRIYTECAWCGTKQAPIFGYRILHDDGGEDIIKGLFCQISCMRSYHGA